MNNLPFTEKQIAENVFLRYFHHNVLSEELIWHQDREDRIVEVIQSDNWYFQKDDQIPFKLEEGMKFSIKKDGISSLATRQGRFDNKTNKISLTD